MKNRVKKLLKNRMFLFIFFLLYVGIMSYFLFLSEQMGRTNDSIGYRYNLVPLKEINRYIKRFEAIGFLRVSINLLGNIIAFIPFGFFLSSFYKNKKHLFRKVFFTGVVFVGMVELIQFVTMVGSLDIDDLFLNSLRILLGYLFFRLFFKEEIKSDS